MKNIEQALESLSDILKSVQYPNSSQDLISGGAVKEIVPLKNESGKVQISLSVGSDRKQQLSVEAQIRTTIAKSNISDLKVKIKFLESTPQKPQQASVRDLNNVKYVVAVASGKGGVGKSTVAVNLASALTTQGLKVGLLDADIYGPSIGKLVNSKGKVDLKIKKNRITPLERYRMKIISFSFLIDEAQAVVWRGPMLGKALEQFLYDIEWGRVRLSHH